MNWFQSILHRQSLVLFRSRAKKEAYPHQFLDFERAKTMAYIVNTSLIKPKELVHFTQYITELEHQSKKNVLVIELNLRKKASPMFNKGEKSILVEKNDLNYWKIPTDGCMKRINDRKVDILFNLDPSDNMTSHFICGLSNAKMRVGTHRDGMENYYDLLVQIEQDALIRNALKTYEEYTKMIEK